MEERRIAREKRRKLEEEEKKRKEIEFEERKKKEKQKKDELENSINNNNNYIYPTKTFKNENPIQEEKIPYKKSSYNSSKLSGGKYENKFYLKQKIINKDEEDKDKDKENKKLEKNLKEEFAKNETKENKENKENKNIISLIKEKNYDIQIDGNKIDKINIYKFQFGDKVPNITDQIEKRLEHINSEKEKLLKLCPIKKKKIHNVIRNKFKTRTATTKRKTKKTLNFNLLSTFGGKYKKNIFEISNSLFNRTLKSLDTHSSESNKKIQFKNSIFPSEKQNKVKYRNSSFSNCSIKEFFLIISNLISSTLFLLFS